ncbi:FAD:protein FMN transferase [soil metagenome]
MSTAGTTIDTEVVRRVEQVMGMPISLALRGRHAGSATGAAAWEAVLASLRWTDDVFSTWREETVISRLGRGELTIEECPPEVAEVLELGEAARRATDGAFDVRRLVGGRSVLDPSGVVKGWAVDRASAVLRDLDDTDFCLSAGGDMICSAVADRPEWRIGVEDPADPQRILAVVPVRDGAVATSGAAHRGDHVLHAVTGLAPVGVASVTVVHNSLTIADLDATCAYLQGPEAAAWLRARGRTGVVVHPDGMSEVVPGV